MWILRRSLYEQWKKESKSCRQQNKLPFCEKNVDSQDKGNIFPYSEENKLTSGFLKKLVFYL
jgi:hypothetical protein